MTGTTTSTMSTLRVITWNLLFEGLTDRLDVIAGVLADIDADLVCLQEVTADSHAFLAHALGHTNSHFVASGVEVPGIDGLGNGISTSLPLLGAHTIAGHSSQHRRRYPALAARTPLGTAMFVSAHLHFTPTAGMAAANPPYEQSAPEPSAEHRIQQIRTIDHDLGSLPRHDHLLLCGDLNLLPDSVEYRSLLSLGWIDAWRQRPRLGSPATIIESNNLLRPGENEPYLAAFGHLPHREPNNDYTLDYQLSRPDTMSAVHAWTVGRLGDGFASDHLGVVVDYERSSTTLNAVHPSPSAEVGAS